MNLFDEDDIDYNITSIQFGVASPEEIIAMSVCEVNKTILKEKKDKKIDMYNSVYDPRMGIIKNNGECETCNKNMIECPGHFGHIVLNEPIIHPKFFKKVVMILKCVCESCSASLITKDQAMLYGLLKYKSQDRLKNILEKSEKIQMCPNCNDVCPKYIVKDNNIKKYYSEKKYISVHTRDIYNIFLKITDDAFELLGFNNLLSKNKLYTNPENQLNNHKHRHQIRPEWLIFTVLPVLPICARPYSTRDGEQNDDDLTGLYVSIITGNEKLKNEKKKITETKRKEIIAKLEDDICALIDNSDKKTKISGSRPYKGIKERISAKEGQVRKHIMGKRVNFSARTVIGGDPSLHLDELGVPEQIAQKLTKKEIVTELNIERINKLLEDNKINYVSKKGKNSLIDLTNFQIYNIWKKNFKLDIGDTVERQLQDGDWVLFNRQPTLRIESMMGFHIKIMKGKTFRLNLSVTPPFNADFDGDKFCPKQMTAQ